MKREGPSGSSLFFCAHGATREHEVFRRTESSYRALVSSEAFAAIALAMRIWPRADHCDESPPTLLSRCTEEMRGNGALRRTPSKAHIMRKSVLLSYSSAA